MTKKEKTIPEEEKKGVSTIKLNIYQKLSLIQHEAKELIRTEENKFQKYKFFNELQVLKLLRPLLNKYKLTLLLSDDTSQPFIHERGNLCANCSLAVGEKGSKEHFVKYLKKLEIVDNESPDNKLLFNFWAAGSNVDLAKTKGSSETYAIKYMLSKFFLMPVKDEADPDYWGKKDEKKETNQPDSIATSVPDIDKSLTELQKQTSTISIKQVEDLIKLFRNKAAAQKERQTKFLSELDKLLTKRGIEGTTNSGNFRVRLASLTSIDYQWLWDWLVKLEDSK